VTVRVVAGSVYVVVLICDWYWIFVHFVAATGVSLDVDTSMYAGSRQPMS
jgi:hypothetical protein